MFFIMEDGDEGININTDPFGDSYARDTNPDELKNVRLRGSNQSLQYANRKAQLLNEMIKSTGHIGHPLDPRTYHKLESHIQARIESGYTTPRGWLFRGLAFYFYTPEYANGVEHNDATYSGAGKEDTSQLLACNTARFAGATLVTSLKDTAITHIMVNPDTTSSADIVSLRKSLAGRLGGKIPHLVTLEWVEESWKNRTLLDEEREFLSSCSAWLCRWLT